MNLYLFSNAVQSVVFLFCFFTVLLNNISLDNVNATHCLRSVVYKYI